MLIRGSCVKLFDFNRNLSGATSFLVSTNVWESLCLYFYVSLTWTFSMHDEYSLFLVILKRFYVNTGRNIQQVTPKTCILKIYLWLRRIRQPAIIWMIIIWTRVGIELGIRFKIFEADNFAGIGFLGQTNFSWFVNSFRFCCFFNCFTGSGGICKNKCIFFVAEKQL